MAREAGFTLIETVAVMAIIAILAAIALPRWPHATNRPMLEAYALQTAALLKPIASPLCGGDREWRPCSIPANIRSYPDRARASCRCRTT